MSKFNLKSVEMERKVRFYEVEASSLEVAKDLVWQRNADDYFTGEELLEFEVEKVEED